MLINELEHIKNQLKKIDYQGSDPQTTRKLIKDIKKELTRLNKHIGEYENKFDREFLSIIRKNIKGTFTRENIWKLFPKYSKEELITTLRKLIRNKKIENIGRDLYSLQKWGDEPIVRLSKEIENLRRLLDEHGINFLITGLDIVQEYINLIPKRMIHLIYLVKGSGEWVKDIIEKETRKMCIINPTRRDVRNLFAHYGDDIIVIREVGESSIEYHKNGIATIEKAIVDLYFETTRKRIPFDFPELANILQNILMKTKIDYKRLLRAAARRNIQTEFLRILDALGITIPQSKVEELTGKSKVDKVINLFR